MAGIVEGKVALVTGAGAGIGRGIALEFSKEGAKVVVADKVLETAKETARMIEESGRQVISVQCDVSKEREVKGMIDSAVSSFGSLDCAVNNAGIEGMPIPFAEYPEEVWNQELSVNLTGVFLCLKNEVAQMLKQKSGAIVNISSAAGLVGIYYGPAYAAAKHGVVGLTKSVALQYAQSGIRVNAVCPGIIRTPMVERLEQTSPDIADFLIKGHPVHRLGEINEVAASVVWLCSDSASFVTGHAMPVDGGYVAQ